MKRGLIAALTLIASPALAGEVATPPPAGAVALLGPALHVSNIDRELKFYVDGLGMKKLMQMGPAKRRETMLGFGGGPSQPGLILLDDTTATAPPAIAQSNGFDRLVMRVSNLTEVVARLRGLGFEVADIRSVAMGYSMAFATDPDGYKLELVESAPKRSK